MAITKLLQPKAERNLPRDVFLYLLSIITLIGTAVSFGIVIFQVINIYFPDPLADYYMARENYFSQIRSALAFLVVIFPVFVWTMRFLRRDLEEFPEKRELKIRKWLLYFTVFVAALVIIGDLVALIRNYLQGEISARFLLKIASIFFIAGSIFYYYFNELKEKIGQDRGVVKMFTWLIISVVTATAVGSFIVAGTPQNQRLYRFDERRVNDLQNIQSQIIDFWSRKQKIPANLGELDNDLLGVQIPSDPKTNEQYVYEVTGKTSFRLCAVFETNGRQGSDVTPKSPELFPYDMNSSWIHEKGKQCFDRNIDPQLFPPYGKPVPLTAPVNVPAR
jgi:hypothetical protein